MIVHLGVVVLVVGYIASTHVPVVTRGVGSRPARQITIEGHTLEYLEQLDDVSNDAVHERGRAHSRRRRPRCTRRRCASSRTTRQAIGTPSVRTTPDRRRVPVAAHGAGRRRRGQRPRHHRAAGGVDVGRRRHHRLRHRCSPRVPGRRRNPLDPVSAPGRRRARRTQPPHEPDEPEPRSRRWLTDARRASDWSNRRAADVPRSSSRVPSSALVMVLLVGRARSRARAPPTAPTSTRCTNKPAPEIVGTTLDGKPFDLDELRGKWVVVNFFAHVVRAVPAGAPRSRVVRAAPRSRRSDDVQLVSVVFNDDLDKVQRLLRRRTAATGRW